MLSKITLLTAMIIGVLYPLCFWISAKDPLKNNFHRFHIGLPCVVAGFSTFPLLFYPSKTEFVVTAYALWAVLLLIVCAFYWNKPTVNPFVVTLPCLLGIFLFSPFGGPGVNPW